MLTKFTTKALILSLLYAIQSMALQGQATIRAYQQIYSDNLKGGTTVIGNTGMHILNTNSTVNLTQMNEIGNAANGLGGVGFTQYGNDNSNMQFIDIDGLAETYSSSSADLSLPAGTNTIKFARLYWGGRINNTAIAAVPDTLRKIKIRKGNSVYSNILSPVSSVDQFAVTATETIYQCYADITSYVQAAGVGTYSIGNIPATPGAVSGGGMNMHRINGLTFVMDRIDWQTPLNSLEEWKILNASNNIHPMHSHSEQFQVYSRNGSTDLPPADKGWKDTVLIYPFETVRLLVRFTGYKRIFLFHCHNLEHEDDGMMLNYKITDPFGNYSSGTLKVVANIPSGTLES